MIRSTHTLAQMAVSPETYAEIEGLLKKAGYDHALLDEGADGVMLDMTGIGLVAETARAASGHSIVEVSGNAAEAFPGRVTLSNGDGTEQVYVPERARIPGLPVDTNATAIGYSADGRPWVLRWIEGPQKFVQTGPADYAGRADYKIEQQSFWAAAGCDGELGDSLSAPFAFRALRDEYADFIVEHELVEVRS